MATLATGGGGSTIGGGEGGGGGPGVGSGETGGGVASGPNGSNLLIITVLTILGVSDGNVSRETCGGSGGGGGGSFEPNAALSRNGAPAEATVIAAHGTHHGTVLGSHGAKSDITGAPRVRPTAP